MYPSWLNGDPVAPIDLRLSKLDTFFGVMFDFIQLVKKVNTDEEIAKMFNWLTTPENYERYPFQAEIILLMMITGRRAEETMKIRKTMIDYDNGLITLPSSITKARKTEYIDITPPVAKVLNRSRSIQTANTKHINF